MPVLVGGRVLVASESDTLFAVERADGQVGLAVPADASGGFTIHGVAAPLVQDGTVYAGFSDGYARGAGRHDWRPRSGRSPWRPSHQFIDVEHAPR